MGTIPQGSWGQAALFRGLVERLAPIDMGTWRREEVAAALTTAGWKRTPPPSPHLPANVLFQRLSPEGPGLGTATVLGDASDRVSRVSVLAVEYIRYDADPYAHVDLLRSAWYQAETVLDAPTRWINGPGMLWQRGGADIRVRLDGDQIVLDLFSAKRTAPAGDWYTAYPAEVPPARLWRGSQMPWDRFQRRLEDGLYELCKGVPLYPGRFILHLGADRDPTRFVQCWNDGMELVIEATGLLHVPGAVSDERLRADGWTRNPPVWQRRWSDAGDRPGPASRAGAAMLTGMLRRLGVDPAELNYSGSVVGRGSGFHLVLPRLDALGVHRGDPDAG
ncbi:TY-Chap domain-containing protein [Actinomadura parmotrematis]|uniref:TY-Chap N-terminal domain-containing protein n=1 Tax=Actinomadura parmotrematis TaxID=2864039 RepID=A0ABS7FPR1_9ACTN|nr:hypothetical protein [Actinomadura parmotrematis]MBW8482359.1 hypothetical protein [Actinomadura parmotrematis]